MKRWLPLLLLVWCVVFVPGVTAHEVRPAFLELTERAAGEFDVLWKVPARGGAPLAGEEVPHVQPALGDDPGTTKTMPCGCPAPTAAQLSRGVVHTETITLAGTPVTVEAADNIGYGFWTHQIQGGVSWYPWGDRRMAVVSGLTYEFHHQKEDFDLTPGQNFTLNYGVSQFLPLKKDQSLLLEVGQAGYSSWQITEDSRSATNSVKDEVHAIGGQLALTYVPWNAAITFHYFYEVAPRTVSTASPSA